MRAVAEQRSISDLAAIAWSTLHMVVDDLLDVLQVLHAVVACLIPCRSNQRPNLGTSYLAIAEEPATVRVGAITHVMGDFGDIRVGGPLREGAVKSMIWCGAQQSATR